MCHTAHAACHFHQSRAGVQIRPNGPVITVLDPGTGQRRVIGPTASADIFVTIMTRREQLGVPNYHSGHPDLNRGPGMNDINRPGVWHWASGEAVSLSQFRRRTSPNGMACHRTA